MQKRFTLIVLIFLLLLFIAYRWSLLPKDRLTLLTFLFLAGFVAYTQYKRRKG